MHCIIVQKNVPNEVFTMAGTDSVISDDVVVIPRACVVKNSMWENNILNMILWKVQCFLDFICT